MSTFALTPAWQKVASAGQSIVVMNRSSAAAYIMTATGAPPASEDGIVLNSALPSLQIGLTADLYARAPWGAVTLVVMDGITASIAATSSTAAASSTATALHSTWAAFGLLGASTS